MKILHLTLNKKWGAEPGKVYFILEVGELINNHVPDIRVGNMVVV